MTESTLSDLQKQLSALSAAVERLSAVSAKAPGSDAERVLAELATCREGKPGSLTTVELQKRLSLTKPSMHYHIGVLETAGQVLVVRGRRVNGRRGPDVVYHRDAIVV